MAVTARVKIIELMNLATDHRGSQVMAGKLPGIVDQVVAVGVASAQSAAFNGSTRFIYIDADTPCYWTVGANPTAAAATSNYIPAGGDKYIGVEPGHKLACIAVPA